MADIGCVLEMSGSICAPRMRPSKNEDAEMTGKNETGCSKSINWLVENH